MSDETIVAIYDTPAHAELARADLLQAGVPEAAISVHTGTIDAANAGSTASAAPREEGFWSSLFGGSPDHDTAVYDRSVQSGASVLSVKTPEAHIDRVLQIIESHNPIDIDDRAASYAQSTTAIHPDQLIAPKSTPVAAAASLPAASVTQPDNGALQLSEENLTVGKRVVNQGGTRIRRFVVERPVEENVTLHSEKVVLDRHPVTDGRPVSDSFSEKTIEMIETAEEAIVSKTAHVYEEVGLRKEATDRVETVHGTVRKEEVEIEKIPGQDATVTKVGSPTAPLPKI